MENQALKDRDESATDSAVLIAVEQGGLFIPSSTFTRLEGRRDAKEGISIQCVLIFGV